MEYTQSKKQLRLMHTVCDGFEERSVDMDIILPDYYPEIAVILKCIVTPRVSRCFQNGDRYSVDGAAYIRVLYLSDDRCELHCYETTQPFNVSFRANDALHCEVTAKTDYVNCRAVSARRMDIHGAFRVNLNAKGYAEYQISDVNVDKDICCKTTSLQTCLPVLQVDKSFSVTDSIPIGSDAGKFLYADCTVLHCEHKLLVNKAILKGVLRIRAMVVKAGNTEEITEDIPFSQIIDADGLCDEWQGRTKVSVSEYDVRVNQNESGASVLSVCVKLLSSLYCEVIEEHEVVEDAYSVLCPLLCEKISLHVPCVDCSDDNSETMVIPLKVQTPEDTASLIDVWGDLHCDIPVRDEMRCCYTVNAVVRDHNGKISCIETSVDHTISLDDGAIGKVELIGMKGLISGGFLHVQAEIRKMYCRDSETEFSVVSDMVKDEQKMYEKNNASVRIVYADSGDSVWDIAKEHHARVDEIIEENDLTSDKLRSSMMLVLPI